GQVVDDRAGVVLDDRLVEHLHADVPADAHDELVGEVAGEQPHVGAGRSVGRPEAAHRIDDRRTVQCGQITVEPADGERAALGVAGGPEFAAGAAGGDVAGDVEPVFLDRGDQVVQVAHVAAGAGGRGAFGDGVAGRDRRGEQVGREAGR